jgi:hypothetical protein
MEKKVSNSKNLDALSSKSAANLVLTTAAYNRVVKHGTFEGIFLSNQQLSELSNKLESKNADGAFFLIGQSQNKKSVEVIPFKLSADVKPQFYVEGGIKGNVNIDLGRPFAPNVDAHKYGKLVINRNGLESEPVAGGAIPTAVKKGTSQKTPPPSH